MHELREIIGILKQLLEEFASGSNAKKARGFESKIRETARKALRQNDLRIPAEILFTDISNSFFGFEGFDDKNKTTIVDEALQKVHRLESLQEMGQLLKDNSTKLPPPPDYLVKQLEKERLAKEKEKAEKEEEQRKRRLEEKQRRLEQREQEREKRAKANKEKQEKLKKSKELQAREASKVPKPAPERKRESPQPKPKPQKREQVKTNGKELCAMEKNVRAVSGVGSIIAGKFANKGVNTVRDLLYYLPRDYEDRRKVVKLNELENGTWCTSLVKVEKISVNYPPGRKSGIISVLVSDETGKCLCKYFGGRVAMIKSMFPEGEQVVVSGEVETFKNTLEFHHPDVETIKAGEKPNGQILSVYSETEGLTRRRIRGLIRRALDDFGSEVIEALPQDIRKRHKLLPINEALESVHFPPTDSDFDLFKIQASQSHHRLVFEELFLLQLGVLYRRQQRKGKPGIAFKGASAISKKIKPLLPFTLTRGQESAIKDILSDMESSIPMARLLQGDVGSGKTIVALYAAAAAIDAGYQAAIMAPTEVLANQHAKTLSSYMEKLGFKMALLTGGIEAAEKKRIRQDLKNNKIQLVIGTHALIQETTTFAKLGLVVIDEQHRFGVSQRRELTAKGLSPDVLTMTATPIPRTLAMTAYGDLDVSVIRERPKGRAPIRTRVFTAGKRKEAYDNLRRLLSEKKQCFVVFPLVDQNNDRAIRGAVQEAERLAKEQFKDYRVGLVHGRMRPAEKEKMVNSFAKGELDLLVATTVIEVGIDIPNAAGILIEHAERFGLAQLHQLRGRVGRGDVPGECYLVAYDEQGDAASVRLKDMEKINDGLQLAEKDLELRGQGDLLGTRQHGLPILRIASLARDYAMLEKARKEAAQLLKKDKDLNKNPENECSLKALELWWNRENG